MVDACGFARCGTTRHASRPRPSTLASKRFRMAQVVLEVLAIGFVQFRAVAKDQQILGVAVFGGGGEIEAAGDDRAAVDQHDFVVSDLVLRIDECRNPGPATSSASECSLSSLLIEHHASPSTPRRCASIKARAIGCDVNE